MKSYLLIPFVLLFLLACNDDKTDSINIYTDNKVADGLDLKAVGEIIKKTKDAKELEKILNEKDSVNNLDIDGNSEVDFIKVTEYENGEVRGFSLTVEPEKGESQEVATIEIEKNNDNAEVHIQGSRSIYGDYGYYHYSNPYRDFLIASYLFSPHSIYDSPFYYGYYPSYYSRTAVVSHSTYVQKTTIINKTSKAKKSKSKRKSRSPNKGKSYSKLSKKRRSSAKSKSSRNKKGTSKRNNSINKSSKRNKKSSYNKPKKSSWSRNSFRSSRRSR